ncbi:pentapeptide MXKDX repeat protein [Rhizobium azooxidifex]|uniref:Pentapeptide MXKDX repeat protein n=1 Tax=Mycoplana azooxidifex TaxID=1636188 RepID=A0A7W6D8G9_9HYPH|nr:hypothetical protein [Mycoplana azooxidifex]MBB3976062.1 pentapeptide MXKDX repeat protein [Mycoplana azooxidifex]
MNSFLSRLTPSVAACALLAAVYAAAPVQAEDVMKSDILDTYTMSSEAVQPDATTTAATKADCLQKAEMETDSVKKAEMTTACDAMQ